MKKWVLAVMRTKPVKHSLIELLLIGIHCAAMTSKRHLPADTSGVILAQGKALNLCLPQQ
jgi:hypothetical protein